MGYLLRMSEEIREWLADLARRNPQTAALVGQALTALVSEGAGLGPPAVVTLARSPGTDLAEALDQSYEDRVHQLLVLRRHVADTAELRRDVLVQIGQLETLQVDLGDQRARAAAETPDADPAAGLGAAPGQLARLRRLLTEVTKTEQELTERSRSRQQQVDAFRTRKEILKASYRAAQAEALIDHAGGGLGLPDSEPGPEGDGAPPAAPRLNEITEQIERELLSGPSVEGLLELRPGVPGSNKIRIIFAVEPPGTALLIAVVQGRKAVRRRHREAALMSAGVLRRVQAGHAPDAVACSFDGVQPFLREFFPGGAGAIKAAAAELAARAKVRTLAEQRGLLGLTQAQVAGRMGVPERQVDAIERAEPGTTEFGVLASYLEALGGRLEIVADFDGERVLLRSPGG
ncbi:MAG: hypothetical protein ABJB47_07795 [Actinomycetota bacterium]